ncbi:M15 family metallopeptidase [Pseudoduganella sp. S-14]|jgi:peptidoglycan LD-endopeptidase CwlK|uniref:M15 family metallopeptidase n=1 Tax=Pseudoduganella sp. S-14 TaxID=3404065 RepID=UPI003CEDD59E
MDTEMVIRAVQRKLGIEADGRPGPITWAAIYSTIVGEQVPAELSGNVDARSEAVILTLHPTARPYARALVNKAASIGIDIKVISGLRSFAEQDKLYAQGRTTPGKKVTNAKGGQSNHNYGIAFDVGVFDGPKYLPTSPKYKVVGGIGQELGLEWGGKWTTIVDEPHFQLRPDWAKNESEREMLVELFRRHEQGLDYYA